MVLVLHHQFQRHLICYLHHSLRCGWIVFPYSKFKFLGTKYPPKIDSVLVDKNWISEQKTFTVSWLLLSHICFKTLIGRSSSFVLGSAIMLCQHLDFISASNFCHAVAKFSITSFNDNFYRAVWCLWNYYILFLYFVCLSYIFIVINEFWNVYFFMKVSSVLVEWDFGMEWSISKKRRL